MGSICQITLPMLHEEVLRSQLYPNLGQSLYWDDSFDSQLYVELARAGFICISHVDSRLGPVLIPELQRRYAVLDWANLHCSRNLRRLLRSQRLADEAIELRIGASTERVVDRLVAYHGRSWLVEPYTDLIRRLPHADDPRFAIRGIELWSGARDELVAGELGYTIGSSYTSLSGFCTPDDPARRHFGTLQLYLLAEKLAELGYAFWNMGHPSQPYKRAIGARIISRRRFLQRWLAARDAAPASVLGTQGLQPVPAPQRA